LPDLPCQYQDIDQKAGEIGIVQVFLQSPILSPQAPSRNENYGLKSTATMTFSTTKESEFIL